MHLLITPLWQMLNSSWEQNDNPSPSHVLFEATMDNLDKKSHTLSTLLSR